MKLTKIRELKGELEVLTGLHIGSGDAEMRISGMDNPVIKHPHTQEPYIPGSSIKGKMRSLLEQRSGHIGGTNGKPLSWENIKNLDCNEANTIVKLFGSSGSEDKTSITDTLVTRLSVSDALLHRESRDYINEYELNYTEEKHENSINRITGKAENPRPVERVPSGMKFTCSFSLRVFDSDDEEEMEKMLFEGLKLIEIDALGGSGSRGYGKVKFNFEGDDKEKYDRAEPF